MGGKRLNSPNDLVIDKEERIWFTDPRYGSYEGVEQDCEAVYRIEQDGSLTRVIESLSRPNGILFSLDYKTLYVADSPHDPNRKRALVSFEVNEDLTLSDGKILHDFGTGRGVDGMKLDSEENTWATAGRDEKAGVHIFSPRGELLTVIKTPDHPTNCSVCRTRPYSTLHHRRRISLADPDKDTGAASPGLNETHVKGWWTVEVEDLPRYVESLKAFVADIAEKRGPLARSRIARARDCASRIGSCCE